MKIATINSASAVTGIPIQSTSLSIWDQKYRLKDKSGIPVDRSVNDTFERVARVLAEAEQPKEKQDYWYKEFLWALHQGAIPAGRIISNAGTRDYP